MASSMATRHLWTGDTIDAAPGALQAGGNIEGTEVRIGTYGPLTFLNAIDTLSSYADCALAF